MKLKTLIQAILAFLAFIFLFLPWYMANALGFISIGVNAFEGHTVLAILTLVVVLGALAWFILDILNQLGILKFKIAKKTKNIIDIAAGGALVVFGVIALIFGFADGSEYLKSHPGAGAWLFLVASAVILALNFVKLEMTVGGKPVKATSEKKDAKKDEK